MKINQINIYLYTLTKSVTVFPVLSRQMSNWVTASGRVVLAMNGQFGVSAKGLI